MAGLDDSQDRQRQLRQEILLQVVDEVLDAAEPDQHSVSLRRALELSSLLAAVSLASASPGSGAEQSQQHPQEEQQEQGKHEWLSGTAAHPLGVPTGALEAQLPTGPHMQEAVRQLLPQIEARLAERCGQLAAAANCDGSSYDGLPDHLQQLCTSIDRRPGVQSWGKAADAATQALQLLTEVNELLVCIVAQHKLEKQKEADEAKAAYLHAQCCMLLEKLRVVEGQLLAATYTPATLPALRRVAETLESAVTEAERKLREASTRLAQYKALGPKFEALAREHAAVEQQIAETQYQLQEVETFAQLQQVLG